MTLYVMCDDVQRQWRGLNRCASSQFFAKLLHFFYFHHVQLRDRVCEDWRSKNWFSQMSCKISQWTKQWAKKEPKRTRALTRFVGEPPSHQEGRVWLLTQCSHGSLWNKQKHFQMKWTHHHRCRVLTELKSRWYISAHGQRSSWVKPKEIHLISPKQTGFFQPVYAAETSQYVCSGTAATVWPCCQQYDQIQKNLKARTKRIFKIYMHNK